MKFDTPREVQRAQTMAHGTTRATNKFTLGRTTVAKSDDYMSSDLMSDSYDEELEDSVVAL